MMVGLRSVRHADNEVKNEYRITDEYKEKEEELSILTH